MSARLVVCAAVLRGALWMLAGNNQKISEKEGEEPLPKKTDQHTTAICTQGRRQQELATTARNRRGINQSSTNSQEYTHRLSGAVDTRHTSKPKIIMVFCASEKYKNTPVLLFSYRSTNLHVCTELSSCYYDYIRHSYRHDTASARYAARGCHALPPRWKPDARV